MVEGAVLPSAGPDHPEQLGPMVQNSTDNAGKFGWPCLIKEKLAWRQQKQI
jgi:hypothetical protein